MDAHTRLATGPPGHAVLERRPEAIAHARDVARAFLRTLTPAVGAQVGASVELVVSELVTNAVRHARGATCALRLEARPDAVTVAVTDADPRPPRERTPDLTGGTGGFGWPMVRNVAETVSVVPSPRGKTVRAVLLRHGPGGA